MNTTNKVQVGDSTTGKTTSTTWRCPYTQPKTEQGWKCPRCGRINAPWVRQCDCSSSNWTITTSDWTYKPEWWKEITCHMDDSVMNNPITYEIEPLTTDSFGGSDYWNPITKTYENVSSTQSNTTAYNDVTAKNILNTKTIHNGKTNYKE